MHILETSIYNQAIQIKQMGLTCRSKAAILPLSPEFLVYSSMVHDGWARFTSASSVNLMSV